MSKTNHQQSLFWFRYKNSGHRNSSSEGKTQDGGKLLLQGSTLLTLSLLDVHVKCIPWICETFRSSALTRTRRDSPGRTEHPRNVDYISAALPLTPSFSANVFNEVSFIKEAHWDGEVTTSLNRPGFSLVARREARLLLNCAPQPPPPPHPHPFHFFFKKGEG